jgi:aspartate/methionine/tyrosine aminotransferase
LAEREKIQASILARATENLASIDAAINALGPEAPLRRLPVAGGWCAILEVPRTRDEDAWVGVLIDDEGVIVHPGYFFDFADEGHLVISLLPPEPVFRNAMVKVARRLCAG